MFISWVSENGWEVQVYTIEKKLLIFWFTSLHKHIELIKKQFKKNANLTNISIISDHILKT